MVFKFTKRTGKNINHFQVTLISFACLIDIITYKLNRNNRKEAQSASQCAF